MKSLTRPWGSCQPRTAKTKGRPQQWKTRCGSWQGACTEATKPPKACSPKVKGRGKKKQNTNESLLQKIISLFFSWKLQRLLFGMIYMTTPMDDVGSCRHLLMASVCGLACDSLVQVADDGIVHPGILEDVGPLCILGGVVGLEVLHHLQVPLLGLDERGDEVHGGLREPEEEIPPPLALVDRFDDLLDVLVHLVNAPGAPHAPQELIRLGQLGGGRVRGKVDHEAHRLDVLGLLARLGDGVLDAGLPAGNERAPELLPN
mmetsp:Transcript_13567/g.30955  ORF Transcript_13567/g.30955 Transcript_13567/m.30955 type:complete len:260 (-) Transcript_13567:37-816(-)